MKNSDNNKHARVLVKSDRKGSNPGGFCSYNNGRDNFEGYLKYCFGSKIPRNLSYLRSDHQPIYEAITFELARKFGLKTPDFFVLKNQDNHVEFEDPEKFSPHTHSGRPFYFISRKIHEPALPNLDQIGSEIISKQKVYLESLMIADILGKRQNYHILPRGNDFDVYYLDLGCSFVHATGGFIHLPNELKTYSRNCDTKRDRCNLKGKAVVGSDNKSFVDLEKLTSSFEDLAIPVLGSSPMPLSDLISSEEIEEISSYLIHGLCKGISMYKEQGLLI